MTTKLAVYTMAALLLCSATYGGVLTFDDLASGTLVGDSFYMDAYRVQFGPFFQAIDHTASPWGSPHSNPNVVRWIPTEPIQIDPSILFGYFTSADADFDEISRVGAYFSTEQGAEVRMTAYHHYPDAPTFVAVDSVVLGAPGQSWSNHYAEIGGGVPFEMIAFQGVNSPDELLHFCLDDMTITPVPEPTSILTLAGGLGGLLLIKRRK